MQSTKWSATKDLALSWAKDSPQLLSREADAIDIKHVAILAASSIVFGIVTASSPFKISLQLIPLGIAVLSFLATSGCTIIALWPRNFQPVDSPLKLREDYWDLMPEEAKEHYWKSIEDAFTNNLKHVKRKGRLLLPASLFLVLEVVALMDWLILRGLSI